MLTQGDDFPLHQTPEPIAFSGTDRNFYDRYFFNGYSADGSIFFACALGVYPQLDVMDAAFSLLIDGKQHNIRASRRLNSERMDLTVGPIGLHITEPLKSIRLRVSANDSRIVADLAFEARHFPIEEPRFTRRNGPRLFMDYTRMTQNGVWTGEIRIGERILQISGAMGTRDRSWGIRPVGAADSQPVPGSPQFFWLWAPFNFPDCGVFFHTNDDIDGKPWNRRAVIDVFGKSLTEHQQPVVELSYLRGSRRVGEARVIMSAGSDLTLTIRPTGAKFYMSGLGYTHPVWGHGRDHGVLKVACDDIDVGAIDDMAIGQIHIQALATAVLEGNGMRQQGQGVLEQLLIGPHAPSGLTGVLDGAG